MDETIERYGSHLELLLAEAARERGSAASPRRMNLRPAEPRRARIEIIPMIDVVFFLLVFFMMASLSMTVYRGLPVNLPRPPAGSAPPPETRAITVTRDGQAYLDRQPVRRGRARRAAAAASLGANPALAVVITADGRSRTAASWTCSTRCASAGVSRMAIAIKPQVGAMTERRIRLSGRRLGRGARRRTGRHLARRALDAPGAAAGGGDRGRAAGGAPPPPPLPRRCPSRGRRLARCTRRHRRRSPSPPCRRPPTCSTPRRRRARAAPPSLAGSLVPSPLASASGPVTGAPAGAGRLFTGGDLLVPPGPSGSAGGGGTGPRGMGQAPAGEATSQVAATGTGLTALARPLGGYQTRPEYPESARRDRAEGVTLLRFEVLTTGRVGNVVVSQSAGHRDLDRAAIEAIKQWKFEPAKRGATAVTVWVTLPVRFELSER